MNDFEKEWFWKKPKPIDSAHPSQAQYLEKLYNELIKHGEVGNISAFGYWKPPTLWDKLKNKLKKYGITK